MSYHFVLPANRNVQEVGQELMGRTGRRVVLASGFDPHDRLSKFHLKDGRTLQEAGYDRVSIFFSQLKGGGCKDYFLVESARDLRFFFEAKPWDGYAEPPDIRQALHAVGLLSDRYTTLSVPEGTKLPLQGWWNGAKRVRDHLHGYSYHQSGEFLNPEVKHTEWGVQEMNPAHWPHHAGRVIHPPGHYPREMPLLQGGNDTNYMVLHGPPDWCHVCRGAKGHTVHFGTLGAPRVCQGCFRETMEQWARLLEQELPEPPKEET